MEAPPATGGVALVGSGREVAGLSAWEEGAPSAHDGLCACDGGFCDEGGGFAVIFVRTIVGTAKKKNKREVSEGCRG